MYQKDRKTWDEVIREDIGTNIDHLKKRTKMEKRLILILLKNIELKMDLFASIVEKAMVLKSRVLNTTIIS